MPCAVCDLTHAPVKALCLLQLLAEAADVCAQCLLFLLLAARLLLGTLQLCPQPLGLLGPRKHGLLGLLEVDLRLPQQLVSLLDGLVREEQEEETRTEDPQLTQHHRTEEVVSSQAYDTLGH